MSAVCPGFSLSTRPFCFLSAFLLQPPKITNHFLVKPFENGFFSRLLEDVGHNADIPYFLLGHSLLHPLGSYGLLGPQMAIQKRIFRFFSQKNELLHQMEEQSTCILYARLLEPVQLACPSPSPRVICRCVRGAWTRPTDADVSHNYFLKGLAFNLARDFAKDMSR